MNVEDDEDDFRPRFHWGDLGALALAGAFSLFGLYLALDLMFGGHPLAVLFRAPPQPSPPQVPSAAEQMAAPFHTQPGEVVISTRTMTPVPSPKKPQNPKDKPPRE